MEAVLSPLSKIAKYLIAIPAAIFGVFHFMKTEAMAGMVPIPFAQEIFVYLTGASLIAAAVAIIIGKKARMAATLLAVFLLITALAVHLPTVMSGGDGAMSAMPMLLKDLMIAGGVIVLAGSIAAD